MTQIIVRNNIEDEDKSRLRRRAARHERNMLEEIREILRDAVEEEETPTSGLRTSISSLFQKVGLEFEIPELRGHKIRPVSFGRRK